MVGPSSRFVVIISALLTLLVLGRRDAGGRVPQWLVTRRNGAPSGHAVTALAPDAPRSRTLPTAREVNPSPVLESGADQREAVVSIQKLEEAYRALDAAYAQIRSLQTVQSQFASRGDGNGRFIKQGDDHRERGSC